MRAEGVRILDGTAVAEAALPDQRSRAGAVIARRGRAPRLLLIAFADGSGAAPHVQRKIRACARAAVDVEALLLQPGMTTGDVRTAMIDSIAGAGADAVFVQFPFPAGLDEAALMETVPEELDVDIMTDARVRRFLTDPGALPPVTVSACLRLFDAYDVDVGGLDGVVVADENPFTTMFRESLVRRGARMRPLVPPGDAAASASRAELVVVAAGQPSLIEARTLAPGAIAVDVGYFNAGGRGDIDITAGIEHLAALAPVPGGIGPMTVSCLIDRVIRFAELSATV